MERFFGHAAPGIRYLEANAAALPFGAEGEKASVRHGLHAVENQIRQYFTQLGRHT